MAANRGTAFRELSSFQKIKGRGRKIIHRTCLIAKRALHKISSCRFTRFLPPRRCVPGEGRSGLCAAPRATLPVLRTCVARGKDKRGEPSEERAWSRSPGHGLPRWGHGSWLALGAHPEEKAAGVPAPSCLFMGGGEKLGPLETPPSATSPPPVPRCPGAGGLCGASVPGCSPSPSTGRSRQVPGSGGSDRQLEGSFASQGQDRRGWDTQRGLSGSGGGALALYFGRLAVP